MTDKTKVERRVLVRGIAAVSAAALSSTLPPNCVVAQAESPGSSATSDRFEEAEIKSAATQFSSGATETAHRCLWCMDFLEVA